MLESYVGEIAGIAGGRIADGGQALKPRSRPYPSVHFLHDDTPDRKRPDELKRDKQNFAGARIIFLVRDPRDVMVSIYFEKTKRSHLYSYDGRPPEEPGDLLKKYSGGLDAIISYYNIWWGNRGLPKEFMLVRYEDLLMDPRAELARICAFCSYPVNEAAIEAAVTASDFSQMRRLEQSGQLSYKLAPGDPNDLESYKTRRGVAGGFVEYLTQQQVEVATTRVRERLAPAFGYPHDLQDESAVAD